MSEWTEEKHWSEPTKAEIDHDDVSISVADYRRARACVLLCAGHADLAKCEVADLGDRQAWLDDMAIMNQQVRDATARLKQREAELATLREQLSAREAAVLKDMQTYVSAIDLSGSAVSVQFKEGYESATRHLMNALSVFINRRREARQEGGAS